MVANRSQTYVVMDPNGEGMADKYSHNVFSDDLYGSSADGTVRLGLDGTDHVTSISTAAC